MKFSHFQEKKRIYPDANCGLQRNLFLCGLKAFGRLLQYPWKNKKRKNLQLVWGFTLIEMMVGMAVFIIILSIVVAIFIQAIRNQRLIASIMMVNSEAGTVLEQMTREIRMGYKFSNGGSSLSFWKTEGDAQTSEEKEFSLNGGKIKGLNGIMTSDNVEIQDLRFEVIQEENKKCSPWIVRILMKVAKKNETNPEMYTMVQTSVTSRILPEEMPENLRIGDYVGCGKDGE